MAVTVQNIPGLRPFLSRRAPCVPRRALSCPHLHNLRSFSNRLRGGRSKLPYRLIDASFDHYRNSKHCDCDEGADEILRNIMKQRTVKQERPPQAYQTDVRLSGLGDSTRCDLSEVREAQGGFTRGDGASAPLPTATVHIDGIAELFQEIERLRAMIDGGGRNATSESLLQLSEEHGIRLMQVYTAKEVALMLGVNRVQSVYDIPEDLLPRVQRIGVTHGYLGINVLAYMAQVPPVDVAAAVEAFRERTMADRPRVQPLRAEEDERRRIM